MFEGTDSGGYKQTASPGTTLQQNPPAQTPAAPQQQSGSSPLVTTPSFPGIDAILGSDYGYQSLTSLDKAMSAQDQATMNQRIQQMTAYYGSDTDPLSLLGRIYNSYQDANRTIANTLTGHGMINSGETGFQGARATLAYQQQEMDARMKLQQYIQGLQDAFQAAQRQQAMNEITAAGNAVTNYLNLNQPQPVPGDTSGGGSSGDGSGGSGDGSGAPAAPTAPATTFSWGGKTWGKGQLGEFIQYLGDRGIPYSQWAAAHPTAAALL